MPHVKFEEGWRCRAFFGFKSLFTPPVHLNHFSTGTLGGILERNGFEVITWESEKPSKSKNRLKNAELNTGYTAIDAMKAVSFGKVFPKPVLCVLVRKVGEPSYEIALDAPIREPLSIQSEAVVANVRETVADRQMAS